jgi:hypothetical protein
MLAESGESGGDAEMSVAIDGELANVLEPTPVGGRGSRVISRDDSLAALGQPSAFPLGRRLLQSPPVRPRLW